MQALIDESKACRSSLIQKSCTGKHRIIHEKARACAACTYTKVKKATGSATFPAHATGVKIFLCQSDRCWEGLNLRIIVRITRVD